MTDVKSLSEIHPDFGVATVSERKSAYVYRELESKGHGHLESQTIFIKNDLRDPESFQR